MSLWEDFKNLEEQRDALLDALEALVEVQKTLVPIKDLPFEMVKNAQEREYAMDAAKAAIAKARGE